MISSESCSNIYRSVVPDPEDATIRFASSFSTADAEHQQIYRAEREAEESRIEVHWQQVQRQQKEAASLRKEIAVVEPDLEHHEQELKTVRQATEPLGCE